MKNNGFDVVRVVIAFMKSALDTESAVVTGDARVYHQNLLSSVKHAHANHSLRVWLSLLDAVRSTMTECFTHLNHLLDVVRFNALELVMDCMDKTGRSSNASPFDASMDTLLNANPSEVLNDRSVCMPWCGLCTSEGSRFPPATCCDSAASGVTIIIDASHNARQTFLSMSNGNRSDSIPLLIDDRQ